MAAGLPNESDVPVVQFNRTKAVYLAHIRSEISPDFGKLGN
jgi:hypothetical protein